MLKKIMLLLFGVCNMLFAADVVIELQTGKSVYVEGEPIYFDILVTNYGDDEIKMNEPLAIGWGGYTFKNLTLGASVRDIVFWGRWDGIVQPFLQRRSAERDVGTISPSDINQLLPETNRQYFISVAKHFTINNKPVLIESNSVEITILPKSRIDAQLFAELSKLGSLFPLDNSIETKLFGGRNIPSAEVSDSALTILRRYKTSVYFPYFVSYISRHYTPGLNPNFRGKNDDFLLNFLNNYNQKFAESDRYLSIMHMAGLASTYLGVAAHDRSEHILRNVGLRYREHLTGTFLGESCKKEGRRRGIDTRFHSVDRVIAPERVNRVGGRRAPRTEAEN